VDEAIVVFMNSMDSEGKIPAWLLKTIKQSMKDSKVEMGHYFLEEIKIHAPQALKYFMEEG
jgi:hypothetical protein